MVRDKVSADSHAKVQSILMNLTEVEQRLLSAVINAERDKLYMQKPRGIHDDLWRALTEIIR